MRVTLALLALAFSLASADIVYPYYFESLPPGWTTNGPEWTFGPQGAFIHIGISSGGQPASYRVDMESDSEPIVLPTGTDSVLVSLTCDYNMEGSYSTGEATATIYTTVYLDGESKSLFSVSRHWGFLNGDGIDNPGTYSITFPASAGQEITFFFRASVSAYGSGSRATIDWSIPLLQVTAYCPSALQSRTWARIKSFF